MTSSIIPSPATKQIELKKIDIISCELFSYHIESLIQLKKPEEALPYAKTLLRSSPDEMESPAWFALGRIYQELGIYTKAVNAYKTSIQYDPTESVPWYNLACSYANAPELENFDQKACNALLIAITLDDDPQKLILDISDDEELNPIHHNPRFRKIIDSTSSELF